MIWRRNCLTEQSPTPHERAAERALVLVVCGTADMICTDNMEEILSRTVKMSPQMLSLQRGAFCQETCPEHIVIVTLRLKAERLGVIDNKPSGFLWPFLARETVLGSKKHLTLLTDGRVNGKRTYI